MKKEKKVQVQIVDIYTYNGCYECGEEIHLNSLEDADWIEVSQEEYEILKRYFLEYDIKRRQPKGFADTERSILVEKIPKESALEKIKATIAYADDIIKDREKAKIKRAEAKERKAKKAEAEKSKNMEVEFKRLAKKLGKTIT